MKADEVVHKYGRRKLNLLLKLLPAEDGLPAVLIEGSPGSLVMLAALLTAVADDRDGDGFSISPDGAGSRNFDPNSELGVYIRVSAGAKKRRIQHDFR